MLPRRVTPSKNCLTISHKGTTMLVIINITDKERWDSVVDSFPQADIYYRRGYVEAFRIHGDGEPMLILYEGDCCRGLCVMMKRDVADDPRFTGLIPKGKYFDVVTPYGYGGFIFDRSPEEQEIERINAKLWNALADEGVIAAFFRFHPVLSNAWDSRNLLDVIDLGHTIALDLSSPEVIWKNIISKNRNMIRKAEKSGVQIRHGKGMDLLDNFMEIYNDTMRHDNAEAYYFFKREFYQSIDTDLHDNYEVFYAVLEDKIIAMSIMLFSGSQMHYHLSGSLYEYRRFAPSNLLLYTAALWGSEHGFRTFHLGGGVGSGEDNLYKFKAAFNRNSDYRFSIGKKIIDRNKYDYLNSLRGFTKEDISGIGFFPAYRAN